MRRSCSAKPATRRSSGRGRGRRSRSTACCRGSPAKAPRPCCRPSRWRRSACASCPIRIPNKIADLFEAYLKKMAPKTVEVKVTRMHGGKPWMTAFDNPYRAGRRPRDREGLRACAGVQRAKAARFPVVSTFQEELGLPSVLFGVGLPDENAHAPNEKLDLGNFHNGIIASAFLRRDQQAAEVVCGGAAPAPRPSAQFSDATRRRSVFTCSQICSRSSFSSWSRSPLVRAPGSAGGRVAPPGSRSGDTPAALGRAVR